LEDSLHASLVGGVLIPPPAERFSLEEAYDAQRRIFEMRGDGLIGWKLGATTEIAQERMGLSSPVAGRLAAADVLQTGEDVEAPPGALYAEAELALMLRSDLPPRDQAYDSTEIAAAIGPVYSAIEMCTSRYADDEVEAPALVADNAFAYRLVLGRMLALGWNAKFAATPVALDFGEGRCVQGSTAAVMGDPLKAVVWLANWLSSQGDWLKHGQVIATGSCTGISEVHPGETVRASFGAVEGAAVTIVPRGKARRFG
jgi:2-keto-4-pentenoate hydratase